MFYQPVITFFLTSFVFGLRSPWNSQLIFRNCIFSTSLNKSFSNGSKSLIEGGDFCFLNHHSCSYYCCSYHSVRNIKLSFELSFSLFHPFNHLPPPNYILFVIGILLVDLNI